MKLRLFLSLLMLGLLGLLAGCGDDNETTKPQFGSVRVAMTDAPAQYDQVNIVVREVHIHRTGEGADTWTVVRPDSESTYDLITLRNGVFVTIGFARQIPAGAYDQVRLVLGSGSNVVVGGVTHPLEVPSGQQSGIKVNGAFSVPVDGTAELILDFDAARSIHVTGTGTYMLNPVIRVMPTSLSGAIHGTLNPATDAEVHAIADTDSITTIPATNGQFTLSALSAGTYNVAIDVASGHRDTTITGVVVVKGQTTELGTISLSPVTLPQ